jgi:hypothetical protein
MGAKMVAQDFLRVGLPRPFLDKPWAEIALCNESQILDGRYSSVGDAAQGLVPLPVGPDFSS